MYMCGFRTVSLLGGGTVQIGDPSGRTTARTRQGTDVQSMNVQSIQRQLEKLWIHVKCLGIKHQYPQQTNRWQAILNNRKWLDKLSAIELMRDLGSGMRLGSMLGRDSVKIRMESGEGMAINEFSYPLFQAYDWWSMYKNEGVQMQIGGSDQYGNIIAGMDAVSHMRKLNGLSTEEPEDLAYGLTTPLLTTASGEKFGKSAGNAVWLDPQMLNSFDLYQYFLKTADNDVERYLKLFTFLPMDTIELTMAAQAEDPSQRRAQHMLAMELVELAHGADAAHKAAKAHREAFSHGRNFFQLSILRRQMEEIKSKDVHREKLDKKEADLLAYKLSYAASSAPTANEEQSKTNTDEIVTMPHSLIAHSAFKDIFYYAGLASSKTEAKRMIDISNSAYVVLPHSGSQESPTALEWIKVFGNRALKPVEYLVDYEALVLRAGKSNVRIVHVISDQEWERRGLKGWWEKTEESEKGNEGQEQK